MKKFSLLFIMLCIFNFMKGKDFNIQMPLGSMGYPVEDIERVNSKVLQLMEVSTIKTGTDIVEKDINMYHIFYMRYSGTDAMTDLQNDTYFDNLEYSPQICKEVIVTTGENKFIGEAEPYFFSISRNNERAFVFSKLILSKIQQLAITCLFVPQYIGTRDNHIFARNKDGKTYVFYYDKIIKENVVTLEEYINLYKEEIEHNLKPPPLNPALVEYFEEIEEQRKNECRW